MRHIDSSRIYSKEPFLANSIIFETQVPYALPSVISVIRNTHSSLVLRIRRLYAASFVFRAAITNKFATD